jgi:cytochrome c peroxidase
MESFMKEKFAIVLFAFGVCMSVIAQTSFASDRPQEPRDNPTTPEKIELGRLLFFEPRLSADRSLSCNSCHDVNKGGVDGLRFSRGVGGQLGGRNAPSVLNAAFHSVQFWDGRAATLEDQAKGPLVNPKEMAMPNLAAVEERILGIPGYAPLFKKAFGVNAITIDNVARAIAAYERTLLTLNSPYDRFTAGDASALNEIEKRGLNLFRSVGCASCHSGPHFSGPRLPLGQGNYQKFPLLDGTEYDRKYRFTEDHGRYDIAKMEEDRHFFRVAGLRNIARTAPYFHNGSVDNLVEAVKVMGKTQLGRDLGQDEVAAIAAFLGALSGELPFQKTPVLP